MIRHKFSRDTHQAFTTALRARVNGYFQDNNLRQDATPEMYVKTATAFAIYLVPFILMLTGVVTSVPLMFGLWMVMGLGKAFIGTSVMHDALHGSYSRHPLTNQLMSLSTVLIGIDARVWKVQHNVLHHTYTNIEHADEDIQPRYVLRFSPHQPKRWFHRFQHIYVTFFYGISTLVWVTFKDFNKAVQYRNKGFIKPGADFWGHVSKIVLRKLVYFGIFLGLPIFLLPVPAGLTALMFVGMHFVTGVALSLVFQPAHVTPTSTFVMQEEELIDENWTVHQLLTTMNFGTDNRFLSWFVGGLNFQIEHHLFPNICHVHYPALSQIVRRTAEEHGIPYYTQGTFGAAIGAHFRMLRALGKPGPVAATGKLQRTAA